jgi:hypothetical protein
MVALSLLAVLFNGGIEKLCSRKNFLLIFILSTLATLKVGMGELLKTTLAAVETGSVAGYITGGLA